MRKIVLFFTVILLLLCNMVVYGQSETKEEGANLLPLRVTCGDQYGTSWSGHGNVNCNLNWHNERDGVVRIEVPLPNGSCNYCSGALVNTTAEGNNNRHFILIAGHSLNQDHHYYKVGEWLEDWKFYWHYESRLCQAYGAPPLIYTTGARVVAKYRISLTSFDIALIELDDDPREAWDVTPYYLGWDRSDRQTSGVIIHHPSGDIKKNNTIRNFSDRSFICTPLVLEV